MPAKLNNTPNSPTRQTPPLPKLLELARLRLAAATTPEQRQIRLWTVRLLEKRCNDAR